MADTGPYRTVRRGLLPAVDPPAMDEGYFASLAALLCLRGNEGSRLGRPGLRRRAALERMPHRLVCPSRVLVFHTHISSCGADRPDSPLQCGNSELARTVNGSPDTYQPSHRNITPLPKNTSPHGVGCSSNCTNTGVRLCWNQKKRKKEKRRTRKC